MMTMCRTSESAMSSSPPMSARVVSMCAGFTTQSAMLLSRPSRVTCRPSRFWISSFCFFACWRVPRLLERVRLEHLFSPKACVRRCGSKHGYQWTAHLLLCVFVRVNRCHDPLHGESAADEGDGHDRKLRIINQPASYGSADQSMWGAS